MTTLCGLILAAGASSRMGRDKALLPWPPANSSGTTLLSSAVAALQPFAAHIVVVAGKNADKLAPIVASCGASMAHNPAPERGQFSSLQIGLRQVLGQGCNAAMITPVDCPPLSASSLQLLCQAFEQALASGHWAVAPEHNSRRGHPLLAARPLIDAFLAAPVSGNARDVRRAHAQHISSIPVPDPGLVADLNTPEQYAAASAIPGQGPR
ncbi:MAG TPA: nucleotidyltransferase family protein [Terracidiphilus sp.]|jgi:molybdenum cofactor cytidylyltransferase|nr:nucleotidyltransferase family protein [Terracidiphilus sp.]